VRVRHTVMICGLSAVLAGCSSTTSGSAAPTGSSSTPSIGGPTSADASPSGTGIQLPAFDACRDIPADFFIREGLVPGAAPSDDTRGNLRWMGCQYQRKGVYATTITSTDMTVDQLMQRHTYQFRRLQIAGRDAGVDGPEGLQGGDSCVVLVAIEGGGLDVELTNALQVTTSTDPCQAATDLATKLVPLLPAGS